ncbi:hypothetical protein [Sphingorhabdus contaminans]|uniref:hypothetical protein n=1 Tax=Sphingorhabdus contaminans TaxID=1343899 RepID=UPI003D2E2AB5
MLALDRPKGLLEMLLTYARAFAVIAASIEFNRGQINGLMLTQNYQPIDLKHPVGENTDSALALLSEWCATIPSLNPVCDPIARTRKKIQNGELPLVLHNELESLQNRIFDELRGHYYYPVTQAYAATYANPSPFGEDVYNRFPSARIDIANAGKCIVLGQGTAGVFHLMRVMEVALKVMARKLGIPYAPSWESYINQINKNISQPHGQKPIAWKKLEPIFKEIIGDLTAIKTAWRNPTMHITNEYDVGKATNIYQAVMVLMQRMAEAKFRETGKPIAVKVALAAMP